MISAVNRLPPLNGSKHHDMKKFIAFFLLVFFSAALIAQNIASNINRHKIAVFTPLHLDEAFGVDGNYLYSNKSFPKNSISGLEFYHGVQIAIDSLRAQKIPLDIFIYDTKSSRESLEQQFSKAAADGVELIIANCSISDLPKFAALAADKKITVLNATVPNNGNAENNSYFMVVNPTLQTQMEGIYKYIQNYYANKELVILTRSGNSEDYIKSAFESLNKNALTKKMAIRYTDFKDSLSADLLSNPKNQNALFMIGSLDINFAGNILKQLSALSATATSVPLVIGMPTWENINLSKTEYKGIELIYSTPFYYNKSDATTRNITNYYNKTMYARPSDLVFRAYGLMYKFGRLLDKYGKNINSNLDSKEFKVFYDYDVKPVSINNKMDYYENKKLYFLKWYNGIIKQVQ